MKKLYSFLILSVAFSATVSANTITLSVNNGDWQTNSSWNPARAPQANDTIVIPVGMAVNIYNNVSVSGYIYTKVYGTLQFNHSSKLDLSSTSKIMIYAGGKVRSNGSSASDQVRIGSNTVYKGNSGDLSGPVLLDINGQNPVAASTLPVRFVSFTLARKQSDVIVQWSTAQESNSSHFVIERSENGTNWTTIASVKAAGESSTLINYNYTDKNAIAAILYYRIKQVDLDAAFIYTTVAAIRSENSKTDVNIATASKNTVLVNFSQQVKSTVVIRLLSVSGQLMAQQNVSNPSGQVAFNVANAGTGIYIVSITDNKDIKIAKQILL
ncbi:MAG: T9SS type A sorting domain-containing protein [Bacteroidetes bacterium]|nr:T9SS type A sorting domain-containing protein [Bacteroidota bacterium]